MGFTVEFCLPVEVFGVCAVAELDTDFAGSEIFFFKARKDISFELIA